MRYAIISDVHANLQAFEAVLTDIWAQKVEKIICLGDAVGYGAQPAEVVKLVRESVHVIIMGNHDAAVVGLMDTSEFSDGALLSIESSRPKLDEPAISFLKSLPYEYSIPEFACAHANMALPAGFDYVQTTEDASLSFDVRDEPLLFVGHTHEPAVFLLDPDGSCSKLPADNFIALHSCRYLVNPGSVGMPRTKDLRATYCIYDTDTNKVSFHRVGYDVQTFRKLIEKDARSSEQIAYVLNLLDHQMLPARKAKVEASSAAARKIREAAMAARKAKKGRKVSGKAAAGQSMFLDEAALKALLSPQPVPKQKAAKRASAKSKQPGAMLAAIVFVAVIGLAFCIYAYNKKGRDSAPGEFKDEAAVERNAVDVEGVSPAVIQQPDAVQAVTTNKLPVRFENLALVHRWSFNNSLADSEGGSDAAIVEVGPNDANIDDTRVTITGGPRDQSDFISLGSRLFSGRQKPVTIELWATQLSVKKWGRIFDFGSGKNDSLLMTWSGENDINKDRVEWQSRGGSVHVDNSNKSFSQGSEYHILMVIDPRRGAKGKTRVSWYSARSDAGELGQAKGSFSTSSTLEKLDDMQDNLGRSFYETDDTAHASYNEVRIWSGAASWTVAEMLHKAGPDAVFK